MQTKTRILPLCLAILFLITGCKSAQTTRDLPAATATILLQTEIPPTAPEAVPPTVALKPVELSPKIGALAGQTIIEGESFENINLLDIVSDEDHTSDQIIWSFSGNTELNLRQNGAELSITAPNFNWSGSETITLQACDPDNQCDSIELAFTVVEENDLPVINIASQAVQPNSTFSDIVLIDSVRDFDHADEELTWNIGGNQNLEVQIADGVVSIRPDDEFWIGSETIHFEVCDPAGGCDSTEAQYTILGPSDVLITYVFNAGFLITTGEQKILLDGLHKGLADMGGNAPSQNLLNRLKNAEPPFDNVDLILTTHDDLDHFDAGIVQKHMENNPDAIFVSTKRTVGKLSYFPELQDRLIEIDLQNHESTQFTAQGIEIEALYMNHGEGRPNLGFVFSVGGKKLFHTGDLYVELVDVSYIENYGIPDKEIDIAFVPIFSIHPDRNHREIFTSFNADQMILMHYFFPYDDADLSLMEEYFPEAIIFKRELESWLVP